MKLKTKRSLTAILGATLSVALQGAAAAHFVWLEPAPEPGAVQACFGEWPELRENNPLLEKVKAVRVFAVENGRRRELKQSTRENSFVYADMGTAPVAAGGLTYGLLERPGQPAYLLRYEAVLLRGEGKPQGLDKIAALSRVETGLTLTAHVSPVRPGAAAVTVRLAGKPVVAEVTPVVPGQEEGAGKLKTDAEGRLEIPIRSGWNHVRIMAQDDRPVTHAGKEGKFTRTYLSLMFEAAPDGTAAAPKADPEAVKLLDEAHNARASWPSEFPGFTADAVYSRNGRTVRGKITVSPDYKITYDLDDPELVKALSPSFGSLVMHRQGGGGAGDYQATWRDSETHPLGRAINLNDRLGSFYRVKDRQILQVNRRMGPNARFTTNVLENESTKIGFLPRAWTVSYFGEGDALTRVTTTRVTWKWVGEIFVPATMEVIDSRSGVVDVSRLELTNHRTGQ